MEIEKGKRNFSVGKKKNGEKVRGNEGRRKIMLITMK